MKYFTRNEFRCKCGCGMDTVDYELVGVLDELREHFGVPVTITSGNRCKIHNYKIGGSDNSVHMTSKAADIQVKDTSPEEVYAYLDSKYPDTYGIGSYANWIHIDVRSNKARW